MSQLMTQTIDKGKKMKLCRTDQRAEADDDTKVKKKARRLKIMQMHEIKEKNQLRM